MRCDYFACMWGMGLCHLMGLGWAWWAYARHGLLHDGIELDYLTYRMGFGSWNVGRSWEVSMHVKYGPCHMQSRQVPQSKLHDMGVVTYTCAGIICAW